MSDLSVTTIHSNWWALQEQALRLFREFDALQRVRPYLVPSGLAYQRLEREQARMETALKTLRRHAQVSDELL